MKKYLLGLFTGLGIFKIYYELIKDRNAKELKKLATYLNTDIDGFYETEKHYDKNYLDLLKYSFNLPKQCKINFRGIKEKLKP